jgi:hypothetical protein
MKQVDKIIHSNKTPVFIFDSDQVSHEHIRYIEKFRAEKIKFEVVYFSEDYKAVEIEKKSLSKNLEVSSGSIFVIRETNDIISLFSDIKQCVFICDVGIYNKLLLLDLKDNLVKISLPRSFKKTKKSRLKINDNDNRPERNSILYKKWRDAVFRRDGFTCALTGSKGGKLEAHHIKKWADYPELRYSISNGITLSKEAHHLIHGKEEEYESLFKKTVLANKTKNPVKKQRRYKQRLKGNPRAGI